MIITCPFCAKRYLVEETAIGESGRHVQCIACQHEWFFKPLADQPAHNQIHLDLIGIKSSIARSGVHFNYTWVLMLSSVIVCFVGVYFARHSIAFHFPQSAKIFQLMGLPIEPQGTNLVLENVKPFIDKAEGGNKLIVKGELINNSDQVQPIPTLKIVARGDCSGASFVERTYVKLFKRNAGSCEVAKWTYTPPGDHLFPGEKLNFEFKNDSPLRGAKTINVKF